MAEAEFLQVQYFFRQDNFKYASSFLAHGQRNLPHFQSKNIFRGNYPTLNSNFLKILQFIYIVPYNSDIGPNGSKLVRFPSSNLCPLACFRQLRFDQFYSWQIHNLHLPVGKTLFPFFFLCGIFLHLGDDGMFYEVGHRYGAATAGFPRVGGLTYWG